MQTDRSRKVTNDPKLTDEGPKIEAPTRPATKSRLPKSAIHGAKSNTEFAEKPNIMRAKPTRSP